MKNFLIQRINMYAINAEKVLQRKGRVIKSSGMVKVYRSRISSVSIIEGA